MFGRGSKFYDLAMGTPLVLFYSFGAISRTRSLYASLSSMGSGRLDYGRVLSILSDTSVLVVAFLFVIYVLLRPPPIAQAAGFMPRVAAIAGTYLVIGLLLFTVRGQSPDWIQGISLMMVFCGTTFAAYAVFYLGRSVSLMVEARKLVTAGPYGFIRHPLYLGEQIATIGVVLQCLSVFAVCVLALQICFQFYRMSCEEKILSAAFPEYAGYAQRTYRILPGIY